MSRTTAGPPIRTGRGGLGPSSWTALARLSGHVCIVGVVAVALLGALCSSALTTLVVAPAVGLFAACQMAVMNPGFPGRPSARRVVLLSGVGWALLVPFVRGAMVMEVAGAVLAVVLLCLGALALMGRMIDLGRSDGVSCGVGTDVPLLADLVRELPTPTLLDEWRSSETVMGEAADPEQRAAAIQLRTLLLEEMSRRDPAGVERWLQEGADAIPDRQVPGDSGPAPI